MKNKSARGKTEKSWHEKKFLPLKKIEKGPKVVFTGTFYFLGGKKTAPWGFSRETPVCNQSIMIIISECSYLTSVSYLVYSIHCPHDSRKINLCVLPCANTIVMTYQGIFSFLTKGFFVSNICALFWFLRQLQNRRPPPPCLTETKYEQILFRTLP